MTKPTAPPLKILLGHLAARGDCLYATAVAAQIKKDFPGCHLTWAIGSMCRPLLEGNPDIDEIWEVAVKDHRSAAQAWFDFEKEAQNRKRAGLYDHIFLTQISPGNWQNFDGTVRASIYRGYPGKITVATEPVVYLSAAEVENVKRFALKNELEKFKNVFLFEFSSKSGQSFVDSTFAKDFALRLVSQRPDICVVMSSDEKIPYVNRQIIDASSLSFKENAELTKYGSLLIGCSSGISWLATSNWAKKLPTIQLLKKDRSFFASFIEDFEYRGLSTEQIIELNDCEPSFLVNCVEMVIDQGFSAAREKFWHRQPRDFTFYFDLMTDTFVSGHWAKSLKSLGYTMQRFGLSSNFLKRLIFTAPKMTVKKYSKIFIKKFSRKALTA